MPPAAAAAEPASGARAAQRAERHGAILDATVHILTTEGLAAVTHRAVAREARVPLAATTYYFSSKDELIGEALAALVEDEISRIAIRAAEMGPAMSSPADSAAALAELLFTDLDSIGGHLAQYEVYLEAARRPGLRPIAAHWRESFVALAESALRLAGAAEPKRLAPVLVAGIDGTLVHELSAGIEGERDLARLRDRLEGLFAVILAAD